jgi:hypothetical protein
MTPLLLALLVACATNEAEDPSDWYDEGADLYVQENLTFTDQNYAFPVDDAEGIGWLKDNLFPVPSGPPGGDQVAWGREDAFLHPSGTGPMRSPGCQILPTSDLPFVIDGVATAFPRFYFKTSGCDWDSDEKYYGSFFIQNRTGGVFVLGDTKVAHFDMGDRIRMRARAAKTSFENDMIYAYDQLEIVEKGVPIYYEVATEPFANMAGDPTGRVYRVTGEVVTPTDTFGEFTVEDDDGNQFVVVLDMELTRRGFEFPEGTRITATGPILVGYYSVRQIVITRKGQITVHTD